jgi:hypothetical protein
MEPEQFTQVIEAILAGKYSWACVLILRFAGYNPLHYIPYRTYNRLMKENCQSGTSRKHQPDSLSTTNGSATLQSQPSFAGSSINSMRDLNYLEVIGDHSQAIQGGFCHSCLFLDSKAYEY